MKPRRAEQTTRKTGKTNIAGQNPRANDSPEGDEHHDESRRNEFDPEVADALKGPVKGKRRSK